MNDWFPKEIGFSGDLSVPAVFGEHWRNQPSVPSQLLATLGDKMLLYEAVIIPATVENIVFLDAALGFDDLRDYLSEGKLKFSTIPDVSVGNYQGLVYEPQNSISMFYSGLHNALKARFYDPSSVSDVIQLVERHSITNRVSLDASLVSAANSFLQSYWEGSVQDLLEIPSGYSEWQHRNIGMHQALVGILSLACSNKSHFFFDQEVLALLGTFEFDDLGNVVSGLAVNDTSVSKVISDMHQLEGIPSLAEMVFRGDLDSKALLRV
ncbi:MAG: hypothetical protein R3270_03305, partial [Gammaproteobacteria bacterium]|nr:hypothetical protein [Gammaproteobacteria bacterium]